jgi:hypothetical protein
MRNVLLDAFRRCTKTSISYFLLVSLSLPTIQPPFVQLFYPLWYENPSPEVYISDVPLFHHHHS